MNEMMDLARWCTLGMRYMLHNMSNHQHFVVKICLDCRHSYGYYDGMLVPPRSCPLSYEYDEPFWRAIGILSMLILYNDGLIVLSFLPYFSYIPLVV